MKIRLLSVQLLGVVFLFLLAPALSNALEVPPLRGRVNDYAKLLTQERARALEAQLEKFEQETGHQVAVLTIPGLEGDSLEDFSIRVADSWKIGKKGFDNGAILLVARDDRRLRIEVGYGLEGVMPDAIASRIIREVITPRFRSGDYAGGIEDGVNSILKVTRGEKLPEQGRRPAPGRTASEGASLHNILMITAMVALFIGLTRRRLFSGALGGAASGLVTTLFASGGLGFVLFPALIVGALLGAIGASLAAASARNQWVGRPRSRQGDWGGGVFPGGYGGGGFGGRGGSGGFSGGGGGFGGGGASGSW